MSARLYLLTSENTTIRELVLRQSRYIPNAIAMHDMNAVV